MTDIYERFASLPRARRGTEVIVIVPEAELEQLIGDAQAAEADLILGSRVASQRRGRPRWLEDYDFQWRDPAPRTLADTEANLADWRPKPLREHVPGELNLIPPDGV